MKMKRYYCHAFLYVAILLLCTGCVKEIVEDDADKFVGVYSVSATEYVTWGNDHGTLANSGTLSIWKNSATRISTSGFFSTSGSVSGSNAYFEAFYANDASGYISYTCSPALLSGDVLTLTVYATGNLGGYPYRMTSQVTAIKQ